MRVGLIVYGLDRPLTGIGRYTLELVRAFSELQAKPEVVLLTAGGLGPLTNITGLPSARLNGCRLLPGLLTLGNIEIPRLAKRLQLDLVHDLTGVAPFCYSGKRFRRVVTVQDVIPWSFPQYSSWLDTLIYRLWSPRVLPRMDLVITTSRHSRHELQRHLHFSEDRISVIPNGVSSFFRPLPEDETRDHLQDRFGMAGPYVLQVGVQTERKNIARSLQAFARILPRHPDLYFVLTGPRSWKQTPVGALIERLGIEKSVLVTGPVSEQDLLVLYNGAEIFLFPSLYEGFGLPVLEAMACGTPVITSNTSSLPEVAGDAAMLVDPTSLEEIVSAMNLLLSDTDVAGQLRARGLKRAKTYTWRQTAQQTITIYKQALEASQG